MRYQVESLIKNEIEHVFGRSIVSSGDCIQLSYDVFQKTSCQLNPNTLRRFFGLVKANYPPSYSTLTILSRYCGFHSIDEVAILHKEETRQNPDSGNVLHYMVSLFRSLQPGMKQPSFPRFELYMAEALILTGCVEEGLYYVQVAVENYKTEYEHTGWRKFLQSFYLLQAVALYKKGDHAAADELYDKINPADFYFLRKKFANILYLLLTEKLRRPHIRHSRQLALLLQETGYRRLHTLL